MQRKTIKVVLAKGAHAHCKRSFSALDAIVRAIITLQSAASGEPDLRNNCDKVQKSEAESRDSVELGAAMDAAAGLRASLSEADAKGLDKFMATLRQISRSSEKRKAIPVLFRELRGVLRARYGRRGKVQRELRKLRATLYRVTGVKPQGGRRGSRNRVARAVAKSNSKPKRKSYRAKTRKKKAASGAKNGYIHSAAAMQTVAARQGNIQTLQTIFNLFDWLSNKVVCPRVPGMGSQAAGERYCKGFQMTKATGRSHMLKPKYFVKNMYDTARRGAQLGGDGTFNPTGGHKALACSARSGNKAAAQDACSVLNEVPKEDGEESEEGEANGYRFEEGLRDAARILFQDKAIRAAVLPLARKVVSERRLGESSKGFTSVKKLVKRMAVKVVVRLKEGILGRLVPYVLKRLVAGGTYKKNKTEADRRYKCLCAGYFGQIMSEKLGWLIVPGWRQKDVLDWQRRDVGPMLYSLLKFSRDKAPTVKEIRPDNSLVGQGRRRKFRMPVSPACKYDVRFKWGYCYKNKEYRSRCSMPGCKGTIGKGRSNTLSCDCNANVSVDYAKTLQCKPNKASCNGGSMIDKDIRVEMSTGSQTPHCRRSFSALDAVVRGLVTVVTAANNEIDVRSKCDPKGGKW